MTEEIINGVNISGCKFFIKEHIEDGYTEDDGSIYIKNACGINGTECCLMPECYYKQLKRFEADNKMYKRDLEKEILLKFKYFETLEKITKIIKDLEKEEILSFPDLPLKDNVQMIMSQCNKGYVEILNLIIRSE